MTQDNGGAPPQAGQDLIEVRLRNAAEFAPVRVLETEYERDEEGRRRMKGGRSVPIRIVMIEAADELARLRAELSARKGQDQ
jgi:hypothetical protein